MILAKATGRNSLDISYYENNTGCPRPEVSAFAAAALAACRNGISNYGEYISVTCNGNTIAVICHSPDTVTIKCSCERVFEGKI